MSNAFDGAPPAEPRPVAVWQVWRWPLHWQILLGMLVGALIGLGLGIWAIGAARDQMPAHAEELAAWQTQVAAAGVADEDIRRLKQEGNLLALEEAQARRATLNTARPPAPTPARIVTGNILFVLANLVGQMFMDGLRLIIVPIVTSAIILAVVSIGSGADFGRLGGKTLAYYFSTSTIAILIGLVLVNTFAPGIGSDGRGILVGQDMAAFESEQAAVLQRATRPDGELRTGWDFLNVFRQMVPGNFFAAAVENQLLGLIVVSMIIGFFLSRMDTEASRTVVHFTQGVYDVTLKITELVLRLAPIGVLGLLVVTVGEQYARLAPDERFMEFITGIGKFAAVTLAALLIHLLGVMPLILFFLARVNPLRHFRAMMPAMVTAFSTSSSAATLPVTMECVEKRAGVSNRTTSFVLPMGATVNMDGTALYECVAAIFICQAFGIDLTFGQQLLIVVVALLTSVGVAGVPAASLVAIIVILEAVQAQLPPEAPMLIAGMGMLFLFDRPLDMSRTVVNIFGDSCGAVVIAKTEGETGVLVDEPDARPAV